MIWRISKYLCRIGIRAEHNYYLLLQPIGCVLGWFFFKNFFQIEETHFETMEKVNVKY